MHTMTDLRSYIQRCDREIESCMAYDGPDQFGALWGELDWRVERGILEDEWNKRVITSL